MEFRDNKPIYRHIYDLMTDKIIKGEWIEEERIPSVREFAIALQVNPNTVIRAYEVMQSNELIFNRRGIGYFVALNAKQVAFDKRRREFIGEELPDIFKQFDTLALDIEEIKTLYKQFKK